MTGRSGRLPAKAARSKATGVPVIRPGILHRVLVAKPLGHGSFLLNRVVSGSVSWCVRGKEFAGLIVLVLTVRMLKAAYALSRQVDRL